MSRRRKPMIYRRPNTDKIWLKFYDATGRLVRRSAGTTDEAEARRVLDSILKELEARMPPSQRTTSVRMRIKVIVAIKADRAGLRRRNESSLAEWVNVGDRAAVEKLKELGTTMAASFIAEQFAEMAEPQERSEASAER